MPCTREPSLQAAAPASAARGGVAPRARRPRVEGAIRRERAAAGRGAVTARSRPAPAPTPEHSARPPARGRTGARPAPRSARPLPASPPPAPAPSPAALRPGKTPTRPGSPSRPRGSLPPAPGPQPYLGKIFSCRRRRQEGLSVAPSINSCRLGLPQGPGSPGPGVRSPTPRSAPPTRVAPPGRPPPCAAAPRLYRERRAAPGSGASPAGLQVPAPTCAPPPAPDSLGVREGAWAGVESGFGLRLFVAGKVSPTAGDGEV